MHTVSIPYSPLFGRFKDFAHILTLHMVKIASQGIRKYYIYKYPKSKWSMFVFNDRNLLPVQNLVSRLILVRIEFVASQNISLVILTSPSSLSRAMWLYNTHCAHSI